MKFTLKAAIAALSLGAMSLTAMPASAQPGHGRHDERHGGKHNDRAWNRGRDDHRGNGREKWRRPGKTVYHYDWNRPDPRYGRNYRPDRYYRGGYEPIRVDRNTRIYRGYDDRYYCRRSDGTTGLVVGAAAGGVLGAIIAPGGSEVLGALIGAAAGGAVGTSVDKGEVRCR
jgi:Ni/Co efflux regulator RcnB